MCDSNALLLLMQGLTGCQTSWLLHAVDDLPRFFGGIGNAKLWIGQKGVVMPLHYDGADNLYVAMAARTQLC